VTDFYSVIIAGSRGLQVSHSRIAQEIAALRVPDGRIVQVVSGGEPSGIDRCGEVYAKVHNHALRIFPADWNRHGRGAGPIRNQQMARFADAALVFVDKAPTPGSANMATWMLLLGKPVRVVGLS
jgi:hypothetical protein